MISKNKIKYIRSLEHKKNRNAEDVFIAEGPKIVGDLLPYFTARLIVATNNWLKVNTNLPKEVELYQVDEEELGKISLMKRPQQVLAVFKKPKPCIDTINISKQLSLVLDGIQDPGNLGTIVRIADWFGISTIFCSEDTADIFNPKTIQSTMGSIARVNVVYTDIEKLIDELPVGIPIYGTLLDGDNIYEQQLSSNGLIVMGNEGNGISERIRSMITDKLYIPNYPQNRKTTDSLNVAVATAIVCAEFRRKR